MTIHERHDCRACHATGLVEILNLGDQPPANAYLSSVDQPEQSYPLSLRLCEACGMAQLGHVVDPDILFGGYLFRTGSSQRMVEHFSKLMHELSDTMPCDGLLVEIGANDGVVLASVIDRVRVLGIDPAGIPSDVPMIAAPFSETLSGMIVEAHGQANAIVACNVLGHVDDLDDFMRGISLLLRPNGVFVFEVPYLGEFLDRSEWDTIYHEHLSYLSVRPILTLLSRHGLRLEQVELQNVHGGSIRCRVIKGHGKSDQVEDWVSCHENQKRFTESETYRCLADCVANARINLRAILTDLRDSGRTVIGYGAAAKATVRLNACWIGPDLLPLIIDCTLKKQNKYIPGMHQRIVSPESIDLNDYDTVLILPMNHETEMRNKLLKQGYQGQILTPQKLNQE